MSKIDLLKSLRASGAQVSGSAELDLDVFVAEVSADVAGIMRETLSHGLQPDGSTPMPLNAWGQPRGVATGRLAEGWYATRSGENEMRVAPPLDRLEAAARVYVGIDVAKQIKKNPAFQDALTRAAKKAIKNG